MRQHSGSRAAAPRSRARSHAAHVAFYAARTQASATCPARRWTSARCWRTLLVATARIGLALQSGTSIAWEEEDAAALPALMHSSPEHLQHLLLNLLIFCVRASDGQPVHVAARCTPAPSGSSPCGKVLVLEVAARGHTMAPERAFEAYTQPDSAAAADAGQQARARVRKLHFAYGLRAHVADITAPFVQAAGSQSRLGLHVSRRLAQGASEHV